MTTPRPAPPTHPTPTATLMNAARRTDPTTPLGWSGAARLASLLDHNHRVRITSETAHIPALAHAYRLGLLALTTADTLELTPTGHTHLARTPTEQRTTRLTSQEESAHGILLIGDPWLTTENTGTRRHRTYRRSPLIRYRTPPTTVTCAHHHHGPHRGAAALTDTGLWALITYTAPTEDHITTGLRAIALARYLAHTPTPTRTDSIHTVAALSPTHAPATGYRRPTTDTPPGPARALGDALNITHLFATDHWPTTAHQPDHDPIMGLTLDLVTDATTALAHGTPLTRTATRGPRHLIDYGTTLADIAARTANTN